MTYPSGPVPGTEGRPGPQTFPAVFPAAAPAVDVDEHPPLCPCGQCTDELLARLARPLVPGGALTDRALEGRTDHPRASAGEADARLARAVGDSAREAPTGWDGPVGAGDNSPTGPAADTRRSAYSPSRGPVGGKQGAAGVRGPAAPAGGCPR